MLPELARYRWKLNRYGHVCRNTRIANGKRPGRNVTIYLHRVVYFAHLHTPDDHEYDIHHIDEDKLNNIRENLEALPHDHHSRVTNGRPPEVPELPDESELPPF